MMDPHHPPFLTVSRDDEDDPSPSRFYALAFCEGRKMRGDVPSENVGAVYLTIYFSTHPECSRFSFHLVEDDGTLWTYRRGVDGLDTVEFMMLRAVDDYAIPPAYWRLFPASAIPKDAWEGLPRDEAAYAEARLLLCRILWPFRMKSLFPFPPSFRIDPDFRPPLLTDNSAESLEIGRATPAAHPAEE